MNINIINKILILIIVGFLINNLTNGEILKTVKSYLNICKEKVEEFIGLSNPNKKSIYPNIPYEHQKDFSYNNKNINGYFDDESYKIYDFIKNLINVNTNYSKLTSSKESSIPADNALNNDIMNQLTKILNFHDFIFTNIKLLDKIYYYKNNRDKNIELFSISADVSYKDKSFGSVVISFEIFMKNDILGPKEFKNGLLTITNVKLLEHKHSNEITNKKIIKSQPILNVSNEQDNCTIIPTQYLQEIKQTSNQKKAIQTTHELATKMTDSFNNHFVGIEDCNELFIKPTNSHNNDCFMNDTNNSLIPSIVNLSSCEQFSKTESTN